MHLLQKFSMFVSYFFSEYVFYYGVIHEVQRNFWQFVAIYSNYYYIEKYKTINSNIKPILQSKIVADSASF